ncbi:MAG: 2-amino-4-ketopentanoate thiolase [Firmicutes bacterium]|nr:2-amino-4-ketopentanoate thiolase [Bacillota bacterium]
MDTVAAGTWVQIRHQVLAAGERAPQVPADTADTPLVMLAKGFLVSQASPGSEAEIRTLSGRVLRGELVAVMPRYTHDFGEAVPELLEIGVKVRQLMGGGDND